MPGHLAHGEQQHHRDDVHERGDGLQGVEDRAQECFDRGFRPAQIPTGIAIATEMTTPATTWIRVCSDSSHIPIKPTTSSATAANTASPTPFNLQQSQAVKKISTGQATVPTRKSRTGIIKPATMKSLTGRVMKERLSRAQITQRVDRVENG